MSQIPISTTTYSKLNLLKTKAIIHNKGVSLTWDNIIEALINNANLNELQFLDETSNILSENGKRKRKSN